MRQYAHHKNEPVCPGCEDRLTETHEYLKEWFRSRRQSQSLMESPMHVSWGFRDEASQNEALANGASKLAWPKSKHNAMNGAVPESLALDIFQISENGRAIFDPIFCAKINAISVAAGYKLRWGGEFKTLGDSGHFEMI